MAAVTTLMRIMVFFSMVLVMLVRLFVQLGQILVRILCKLVHALFLVEIDPSSLIIDKKSFVNRFAVYRALGLDVFEQYSFFSRLFEVGVRVGDQFCGTTVATMVNSLALYISVVA